MKFVFHIHNLGDIAAALAPLLDQAGARIMSKITDLVTDLRSTVDGLKAAIDDAVARDTADHAQTHDQIDGLNKQIADLEARMANESVSQADMDAMAALKADLAAEVDRLKALDGGGTTPTPTPDQPAPDVPPVAPAPTDTPTPAPDAPTPAPIDTPAAPLPGAVTPVVGPDPNS